MHFSIRLCGICALCSVICCLTEVFTSVIWYRDSESIKCYPLYFIWSMIPIHLKKITRKLIISFITVILCLQILTVFAYWTGLRKNRCYFALQDFFFPLSSSFSVLLPIHFLCVLPLKERRRIRLNCSGTMGS